jgi:hypothetical protein
LAKYDRQLIVAFLDDDGQASTLEQAESLNQKQRAEPLDTEIVTVRSGAGVEDLQSALDRLSADSRLYLVGSGVWRQRTLSGWLPEEVADLLGQQKMPAVKVISIVADSLGRDAIDGHMDSFAARFHRRLKEVWQIRTVVQARVMKVTVISDELARGRKVTAFEEETPGETLSHEHHRPHSKVKLVWDGETQQAEWAH